MLGIEPFFDKATNTITYVVSDGATKHCAVIDTVLDYEPATQRVSTTSADVIIAYIQRLGLTLDWILETHVHADHLTAAYYLKQQLGGKIGIGAGVLSVLDYWSGKLEATEGFPVDGSQFDCLFKHEETLHIGDLKVNVLQTPGHTPACVSYQVDDAVFVGDLLFMPYMGTGRVDFPGGSAETSYESIQKVLSLPDTTRIFTGHDYPKDGELPQFESSVAIQKQNNILINDAITKPQYIQTRTERDRDKALPRLFYPSIQANLGSGKLGGL
ncbi:MAG: MBL fold metallo-hydrolase [Legionellaceae bacterium]|nr:MBL fold metallo-hydrolase [Legionellaceae bacterium]